jgi:NAD(P)-dependent dehydrogenase (short-subunit alcohol dehydrogenase family)
MGKLDKLGAIVTGTAEGIGEAIAKELAIQGAKVACLDFNKDAGQSTVNDINESGGEALFIETDIADPNQVKSSIETAASFLGSVDILVNNAAKFIFGAVEDVSQDQWEDILKVNVIGYSTCVKEALPHLKKSGKSAVVNLASVSSIIAGPKFVPYNTTKGAVLMLTRSLAVDLAEFGIRVNAVCPGSIHTSATYKHIEHMGTDVEKTLKEFQQGSLLKRQGKPEEIAKAVLFLASHEDSSFITGENLIVDGGLVYN